MADLPRNFSFTIKTTETTRMHSTYVNGNYNWLDAMGMETSHAFFQ